MTDRAVNRMTICGSLLEIAKGNRENAGIKLWTDKMTWPSLLQSIYNEGLDVKVDEGQWLRLFDKYLQELCIDYIMDVKGGRLNPHRFQQVIQTDRNRMIMYGQGAMRAASSGSEWFNRQVNYKDDMIRLFGEGSLPVKDIPQLISRGLRDTNFQRLAVKPERRAALDYLFEAASMDDPLIRLIYSLCVIMSAHPFIVSAGEDLMNKKWIVPDLSRKHRVDKGRWAVAFAFSGIFYSGHIDQRPIDIATIKKGFLGTPITLIN
jgi:hypothetical protein